jgi:hypothetical protein
MSNASYVVGNFMTDGLLVRAPYVVPLVHPLKAAKLYRTFVVWNKSYQVVILPGLLYMGSTGALRLEVETRLSLTGLDSHINALLV